MEIVQKDCVELSENGKALEIETQDHRGSVRYLEIDIGIVKHLLEPREDKLPKLIDVKRACEKDSAKKLFAPEYVYYVIKKLMERR